MGSWGPQHAAEYIAGFGTESSLSLENLFVSLIIFTQFAVYGNLQSQAFLVGIAIALFSRFIFIILGEVFLVAFSWAFYLVVLFLTCTAIKLVIEALEKGDEDCNETGGLPRFLTKTTAHY